MPPSSEPVVSPSMTDDSIPGRIGTIAKADKVPARQKLFFSLGGFTDYLSTTLTVSVLWMPFFNIGMGLNPILLGGILMIMRLWDGFNDPIMGNISDNTRTRWGRRRPFMVIGAIATALIYPLLWRPPTQYGHGVTAIYITVLGLLLFTASTCWAMPYYSLQMELTPSYDERTRISAWMAFVAKFANLLGGWTLAFVAGPLFINAATGKPDIVAGMQTTSWVIALLILGFGLLPPIFVKERYYETETSKQSKDPFFKSLKESFFCKPLWLLIGISFFVSLGSASIGTLGQYVNIYYVNNGDLGTATVITGLKSTVAVVAGILSIPLWTWLSERLDKKFIVGILLLGGMGGHALNYFCLDPARPYLQLIPAVFQSGILGAMSLMIPSMKADIADYDELGTHRRREGSLNSFYSWFLRMSQTCAMGAGGVVLALTGFDVAVLRQPPEVLERMKYVYLLLPLAIWGISLAFIANYPLTRKRMKAIRDDLEARRGSI